MSLPETLSTRRSGFIGVNPRLNSGMMLGGGPAELNILIQLLRIKTFLSSRLEKYDIEISEQV